MAIHTCDDASASKINISNMLPKQSKHWKKALEYRQTHQTLSWQLVKCYSCSGRNQLVIVISYFLPFCKTNRSVSAVSLDKRLISRAPHRAYT